MEKNCLATMTTAPWGLYLEFTKKGNKKKALYCSFRTKQDAERTLDFVEKTLYSMRKDRTFGWIRFVFEQEWLYRNMPRKSVLTGMHLEQLAYAVQ